MGAVFGGMLPGWPLVHADLGIWTVIENEQLQAKLLNDPLVAHDWLPVSYVSSIVAANEYIDTHLEQLDIPLLLHGERDMLIPISSSQEILEGAITHNKSLKIYDSPHTVLIEDQK
jgi:esterase/lipase